MVLRALNFLRPRGTSVSVSRPPEAGSAKCTPTNADGFVDVSTSPHCLPRHIRSLGLRREDDP